MFKQKKKLESKMVLLKNELDFEKKKKKKLKDFIQKIIIKIIKKNQLF